MQHLLVVTDVLFTAGLEAVVHLDVFWIYFRIFFLDNNPQLVGGMHELVVRYFLFFYKMVNVVQTLLPVLELFELNKAEAKEVPALDDGVVLLDYCVQDFDYFFELLQLY